MYASTKTYCHEVGLSSCFRQWRAESHCNLLHGYALSVKLVFAAAELDRNNWVIDFGSLKPVKAWLETQFDHKTVVAKDDPLAYLFIEMEDSGLCDIVWLDNVGCEAFAEHVAQYVHRWLVEINQSPRVQLLTVEVCEHGANSAIWSAEV